MFYLTYIFQIADFFVNKAEEPGEKSKLHARVLHQLFCSCRYLLVFEHSKTKTNK